MTDILHNAKKQLEDGGFTCVILHEKETYTDTRRGVAPLLSLLESGNPCCGASAADKVVGAGAAYLYVLLGIKELYAAVISEPALKILAAHGIDVYSALTVPNIKNRAGDGFCPIETAVADARDPHDALSKIKARLKKLSEEK